MGIPANEGQAMGGMGILSIVPRPTMLQHMHWQRKMYKLFSIQKKLKRLRFKSLSD